MTLRTSPMAPMANALTTMLLAGCLAACSSNGSEPPAELEPKLSSIQSLVFNRSCAQSNCHGTKAHAGDLVLVDGQSYAQLVGKIAENNKARQLNLKRVDPADVDKSFLLTKIRQVTDVDFGTTMPVGDSDGLDAAETAIIRKWIENGAQNN